MRVMLFGHAGVGVAELAGDHRHRHRPHGEQRAVGVAQHMEADRRHDAGAGTGLAHGAHLLGALPGPPVVAPQQRILRRAPGDQ